MWDGTKDIEEHAGIPRTVKSPTKDAETSVLAAVAKGLGDRGGIYLNEIAEAGLVLLYYHYCLGGCAAQVFDPPTDKEL